MWKYTTKNKKTNKKNQSRSSPNSPFNENVIIEIYYRVQVSLGKNINNEWMTLRSRNAPSPILIFTLTGKKWKIIFINPYDIWMRKRYRRPTKARTRTIFQQKPKLELFSNKSQNSNHFPTKATTRVIFPTIYHTENC